MPILTLGELRTAKGVLKVECLRCGDVEWKSAGSLQGPDTLALGGIGLGLPCRACGAKACITTGARAIAPPQPDA